MNIYEIMGIWPRLVTKKTSFPQWSYGIITLFMYFYGLYRNLYKVSAYCCENNITKRKADNAYVISMYVFIFYLFIWLFINFILFYRKNSIKSYK